MVGIVSYGIYIPKYRIKASEISQVYNKSEVDIFKSLNIYEKSVTGIDEDSATMAYESSKIALSSFRKDAGIIESILVGSESKPYAVKPIATLLSDALRINTYSSAVDLEFACKAGTSAIQLVYDSVKSKRINFGLAIGTDSSQAKPGDILEYGTGAGAASFIIGNKDVIAEIIDTTSIVTDVPDFWRNDGKFFPNHRGRFSALTYVDTIVKTTNRILNKNNVKPKNFKYVVFHMPNGSLPKKVALLLDFDFKQLELSLTVEYIGNTYSASSLIGLASILDKADPKDKILLVSYGSGAGSDAFILEVTENIRKFRKKQKFDFGYYMKNKEYINYSEYLLYKGIL